MKDLLSPDTAQWRARARRARRTFAGRLTYGANWGDEAERVDFWDAVDTIGIDAYMPLAPKRAEPSVTALVNAWAPYRERIAKIHQRWKKPVLFTELGYPSRRGAARRPAVQGDGAVDQEAQARAYVAAFRAWRSVPWFRGIYWWEWSADGRNSRTSDGSYRPAGKRAERTLREFSLRGAARRALRSGA